MELADEIAFTPSDCWNLLWHPLQDSRSDIGIEEDSVSVGFMTDFACVAEFFVNGEGTGEELDGLVDCPSITTFQSAPPALSFNTISQHGTNVLP